jgi:hypothetical protein
MSDAMQKLYTPILGIHAAEVDLAPRVLENALAYGPVRSIVVHDTPSWRKVQDMDLLGITVDVIPNKTVEAFEKRADDYFAPLTQGYKMDRGGRPDPMVNHYRAMRNILVQLQISARYKCSLALDETPWISGVDGAVQNGQRLMADATIGQDEDVARRIGAVSGLLTSYRYEPVAGLRVRRAGRDTQALVKALDTEWMVECSAAKWGLASRRPLVSRLGRCVDAVKAAVDSKVGATFVTAVELLRLLPDAPEAPRAADAISALSQWGIAVSDYEAFAPTIVPAHTLDTMLTDDAVVELVYGMVHSSFRYA